jgi:hypothetical protein
MSNGLPHTNAYVKPESAASRASQRHASTIDDVASEGLFVEGHVLVEAHAELLAHPYRPDVVLRDVRDGAGRPVLLERVRERCLRCLAREALAPERTIDRPADLELG